LLYQKHKKKTLINKKNSIKELNTTSFVEHSKPLFYACKHKHKTKTIIKKKAPQAGYKDLFWIIKYT
jgi:hypothetical protein